MNVTGRIAPYKSFCKCMFLNLKKNYFSKPKARYESKPITYCKKQSDNNGKQ